MIPLFKQITVEIQFCRIYPFLQSAHNLHPIKYSLFPDWRVLMQLFGFYRVLPQDLSSMPPWKMVAVSLTSRWISWEGWGGWFPKSAIVHLYIKKIIEEYSDTLALITPGMVWYLSLLTSQSFVRLISHSIPELFKCQDLFYDFISCHWKLFPKLSFCYGFPF